MRAGRGEGNSPFWWGLTWKAHDMEDETLRDAQGAANTFPCLGWAALRAAEERGHGAVGAAASTAQLWGALAMTLACPWSCRTLHPPEALP